MCFRLLLSLAFVAGVLFAQSDRGTITGTVTDQAGALIPGARVTATQIATSEKFNTTTTGAGEFTLPSLPVGSYRVVIECQGFKTTIQDVIELGAGMTARLSPRLEVGTVQQTVEVSAQSSVLQMDDAKLHNDIPDKLIQDLPTVVSGSMRSPFDLANLTAGVQGSDTDVRIGGGQQAGWGATLDGGSVTGNRLSSAVWSAVNSPGLDAIDQFTVDTNGFKAEYGRAGGGMISFVSKSGTDQYHGTAFEFLRNNFFDARGFFANSVAIYRQHDFGASLGGPVRIPKLYNGSGKTFFFFSYEGFRNRVGASTTPIAEPPPEFYSGNFQNLVANAKDASGNFIPITVYDPSTTTYNATTNQYSRTPFPNNQIPTSRIDPLSAAMNAIAQQSMTNLRKDVVPGTWQYWQQNAYQSGSTINPNNKYSIKLDHDLTEKQRISFYFGYNKKESVPGPDGAPGIPGILNGFQLDTDTSLVYRPSWDYTLTPRLHNRFFASITDFHEPIYPLAWGQGWKAKGICMPNVPDCDSNLPMISGTEFGTWGGYGRNGWGSPTYSLNDSLSWNKGRHVFKAGWQYEYTNYEAIGEQNVSGQVGFSTGYTQLPSNTNYTGLAFASYLLGDVSSSTVTSPRFFNLMWNYQAFYVQDDWRVNPHLTVNLGLRYEFDMPTTIEGNKCSDFSPTTPNPGAGGLLGALLFCGNGPSNLYMNATGPPGWYKGFGPRTGFAWNPSSKMVIRGGAGLSYGPLKVTSGSSHFDGFAFLSAPPGGTDQTGGITPAFQFSAGMPPWPTPPLIQSTYDNNASTYWWQGQEAMRLPEIFSWNLSVQREIANGFMVEAGYSAMVGSHLLGDEDNYNAININNLPPSLSIFTNAGRNLLTTAFNSKSVSLAALGYAVPFASFPLSSSLDQSLLPYPQYTSINTGISGDHSGHSTYHALVVKVTRRFAHGLVLDSSYVLSKMFTDAESAANTNSGPEDPYDKRLDKHLSLADRTHDAKVNWVYELPLGPGKRFLHHGIASQIIGGWRVGTTQRYASGEPMSFSGAFGFPGNTISNRPFITTYDGWRAPTIGSSFDPNKDRYFQTATLANWTGDTPTITQQGWFPLQPRNTIGNMTVTNPKMRSFPLYNENISLAKTFSVSADHRREFDLRLEGFNVLNRVQFANPNTSLSSSSFGLVTGQNNTPRNVQLGLKFLF
ncbi:MAG TPA: TonB-dependent receptor [Bryobacteraceae bacterium]|nr:TonB-dependent receptor [Bryobacteraceae bacterium]